MRSVNRLPIVDVENAATMMAEHSHKARGYAQRDFTKVPLGSSPYAPLCNVKPWSREKIIAEIRKRKALGMDNISWVRYKKFRVCDQEQTNYCWVNAVTYGMMAARVRQGQKEVRLSPASLGAKIKNFQNVGGWGLQACEGSQRYGWVPNDKWPDNAIDRRYDTAETRKIAEDYKLASFVDLTPRDILLQATMLLLGWFVPAGYNWWGHEICLVDVDEDPDRPNRLVFPFANSWGSDYGDDGYAALSEEKATADDAQAIYYGSFSQGA